MSLEHQRKHKASSLRKSIGTYKADERIILIIDKEGYVTQRD